MISFYQYRVCRHTPTHTYLVLRFNLQILAMGIICTFYSCFPWTVNEEFHPVWDIVNQDFSFMHSFSTIRLDLKTPLLYFYMTDFRKIPSLHFCSTVKRTALLIWIYVCVEVEILGLLFFLSIDISSCNLIWAMYILAVDGRWEWTPGYPLYTGPPQTLGLVDILAFKTCWYLAGLFLNFTLWVLLFLCCLFYTYGLSCVIVLHICKHTLNYCFHVKSAWVQQPSLTTDIVVSVCVFLSGLGVVFCTTCKL